jgi:ATP synthase F1 complex assembly factor 2
MIHHARGRRAVVDVTIKTFFPSSSSSFSSSPTLLLSSRIRPFSSSASASASSQFNETEKILSTKTRTSNTTAAAADRRLAGRRRFYKHVGIAPIAPPSLSLSLGKKKTTTTPATEMVDSPISAGVDGTQSASGVQTSITNVDLWLDMLNPRRHRSRLAADTSSRDSSSEDEESSLSWYTITLDGRTLRTPLGLPLSIPSLHLALAIGSEWDAQKTHLRPAQMPLMTLCCTTIDQVANSPTSHQSDILRYLANDTTCYYANPNNSKERGRRASSKDGQGTASTLDAGKGGGATAKIRSNEQYRASHLRSEG